MIICNLTLLLKVLIRFAPNNQKSIYNTSTIVNMCFTDYKIPFAHLLISNVQHGIIKETYDKKYNCPPNPTE